jgi:hypothetical protein
MIMYHGLVPDGYTKDNLLDDFNNKRNFINNFLIKDGTLANSAYGNCIADLNN